MVSVNEICGGVVLPMADIAPDSFGETPLSEKMGKRPVNSMLIV